MNFKSVVFLVLFGLQSIFSTTLAVDEEYFQNSIFQALKDKQGQFRSQMKFKTFYNFRNKIITTQYEQDEKYSFKTNHGLLLEKITGYPATRYYLTLGGKEVHSFSEKKPDCFSWSLRTGKSRRAYLGWWAPYVRADPNDELKIFGPNVLLEAFYQSYEKDKESVRCEDVTDKSKENKKNPVKCSITFNETVRLDYEFVDREEHTMFPEKIESYLQNNQTAGGWKLYSKMSYTNFSAIFSEEPIVSTDLPLRKGCTRLDSEGFPQINTDYGSKFELELEVLFNYTADRYVIGREPIYSNRTYSVKLYGDTEDSINVADTIDEMTNVSIRTFYNTDSHLLHSVTLEDNQCKTYNLTSNQSLNWFYVQDMFVRKSELFYTKSNYSFLREATVDDKLYQVFEKKFSYIKSYSYETYKKLMDKTNNSTNETVTSRKKNNEVPVDHNRVIATHYFPKDTAHWPDNPNQLSIPQKIELIIFNSFYSNVYSEMIINFKSFKSSPEEIEKYDAADAKCVDMDKK